MIRSRTATAASAVIAVLGFATMFAQGQAPAPAAGGQKRAPEEIMAVHTKDTRAGNPEAGRPLFEKQCATCHRFGALGKDVGPDLTTITSRFKKQDILDAILWPSKVISDQYQSEMLELKDGKVITGVLVRESAAAVIVRTADNPEKPVSVPKGQIATRAPSTVSLMPEGLLDGLTDEQIADLLAFVSPGRRRTRTAAVRAIRHPETSPESHARVSHCQIPPRPLTGLTSTIS
jgi:putative heme-binding domain-containing protein